MNSIEFRWEPNGHDGTGALDIYVDASPLPLLVHDLELPIAQRNGEPSVAGGYAGLASWACPDDLRAHFLGAPGSHLHSGSHDKTAVLGCDCGEVGCWPFMVHIEVDVDTVRWTDPEQPHRRGQWDYPAVTFVFDRADYESSLGAAVSARRASG